ncbi:hypothetical protein D3C80_1216120 [compost metagenome]
MKRCDGEKEVSVEPSPKFQLNETAFGSLVLVKSTGNGAAPVRVLAVNEAETAAIVTVTDSVVVPQEFVAETE